MNVVFKKIAIIILKILYSSLCVVFTFFVAYRLLIVLVPSFFMPPNFQIILYIILSTALIMSFWSLLFAKIKPVRKILVFLFLLCIQLNYIEISNVLPSVRKVFDMELCMEMNICPEGIKIKNDEGVLFEINKENCIKYKYKWDEQNRSCDMDMESRTCYKQGYEWNIKEGKCSHKIIKDW